MQNLQSFLSHEYGINFAGWTLTTAYAVSQNGLTIAGEGINPQGNTQAWIAYLDKRPTCTTDINNDGRLDFDDYLTFLKNYNLRKADFNNDGITDINDLNDFQNSFAIATSELPEPFQTPETKTFVPALPHLELWRPESNYYPSFRSGLMN
jgi:hypothetical protein